MGLNVGLLHDCRLLTNLLRNDALGCLLEELLVLVLLLHLHRLLLQNLCLFFKMFSVFVKDAKKRLNLLPPFFYLALLLFLLGDELVDCKEDQQLLP